jgi:hypothetical protein
MKTVAIAVAVICFGAAAACAAAAVKDAGTRERPYAMHKLAVLPESKGWSLRVNKVTPNATAFVRAANTFNKPPAAGRQFFMINVTMTYRGNGRSTAFQAGQLNATAGSHAYSFKDTCGVVPSELDEYKKIPASASVTGNVCFSVRKADAASLLLEYEPLFSATNRQLFFALR